MKYLGDLGSLRVQDLNTAIKTFKSEGIYTATIDSEVAVVVVRHHPLLEVPFFIAVLKASKGKAITFNTMVDTFNNVLLPTPLGMDASAIYLLERGYEP